MTPAMLEIKAALEAGAASAMTMEQIICQEISEWLSSPLRFQMLEGERYYRGDPEIVRRIRTAVGENGSVVPVKNLANNKLAHNFIRKLTDQKTGYLLSKPLSIKTGNPDYEEQLCSLFDKAFLRLLKNLGKDAITKGRAWLQIYYDENGKLSFKRIPSEEIIPFWKDAAQTELEAVIRFYHVLTYEGTAKKTVTKVEFWSLDGVRRYIYNNGQLITDVEAPDSTSHFCILQNGEEKEYNWQRVPFVCFRYNDEEIPLLQFLKSLVDDYDKRKSDNANNLEDLPNSIYVVKNYGGTNGGEFRKNISQYRVVFTGDQGGVDTIGLDIDTEAYKTHMEMNRKDIYEFGRGVDTQAKEFGGNPSGVSLKFLYADLDMDANILETEFQASLEQLLWFIDVHLFNAGVGDFENEKVEFIFNRDIVINESDAIANVKHSVGILSDETNIANHPWTTDVRAELNRLQQQREAEMIDPYED